MTRSLSWRRLGPGETQAWGPLLEAARDANLFQSAPWAEFKRTQGWTPERWIASDALGRPVAGVQALLKPLPLGRVLAWAPGGPLTGFPGASPDQAPELLRAWVRSFQSERGVYARFRSHRLRTPDWVEGLGAVLARPPSKINSGVTLAIDLSKPMDAVRGGWTSKHRYYVKQAEKASLEWAWGHDAGLAGELAALYRGMAEAKGLTARLFDPESIPRMAEIFGDRCVALIGKLDGQAVTGCLAIQTGSLAFYLLAATSPRGREVSAAYAMVPRLLELLQGRGVESFDFGGIDPANEKAKGVDHFKKGFGGTTVEYLGEWDWAPWDWLRRAANLAMKYKNLG